MSAAAPPHMKTSSAALAPHSRARDRRVDHRDAGVGESAPGRLGEPGLRRRRVEQQRRRAEGRAAGRRRRATSAWTTAPFGTIVMTMSLRAASSAGVRARVRAGERRGDAVREARARRRRASSRGRRRRGARPSAGPSRRDRRSRASGGRDVMAFRVYEEGRAARVAAGRRCRQTLHDRPCGERYTFCRPRPALGDDHMQALRILARSPRRFALIAGAPAASAQTVLTMSSWVPPTHSLTRDVLRVWAEARSRRRPTGASSSRCCPSTRRRRRAPSTRCATAWSTSRSSPRATRRRAIRCR